MEYEFHVTKLINADPTDLPSEWEMSIVSFSLDVMEKYASDPDISIKMNDGVGIIESVKNGWSLPIDVHQSGYVNVRLNKLGETPETEQQHFASYNIMVRELSEAAANRWIDDNS
jgi:hypothetical protein